MGSSESTLVKTTHCWKSHVVAQMMSLRRKHTLLCPQPKRDSDICFGLDPFGIGVETA